MGEGAGILVLETESHTLVSSYDVCIYFMGEGARVNPKVPCSCLLNAMGKFALLSYLSEFRFVVLIIGNSKSNHLVAQGTFNPLSLFRV